MKQIFVNTLALAGLFLTGGKSLANDVLPSNDFLPSCDLMAGSQVVLVRSQSYYALDNIRRYYPNAYFCITPEMYIKDLPRDSKENVELIWVRATDNKVPPIEKERIINLAGEDVTVYINSRAVARSRTFR